MSGLVLGVDPGTERSAWVVWDPGQRQIEGHGIVENAELVPAMVGLHDALLAVEWVESYGMPVGREVFETVFWIGRFVEAWGGRSVRRVTRREVKLTLCGSARAKDANVRRALLDLVGPRGTKAAPGPCYGIHTHGWAALAVAVVAAAAGDGAQKLF